MTPFEEYTYWLDVARTYEGHPAQSAMVRRAQEAYAKWKEEQERDQRPDKG